MSKGIIFLTSAIPNDFSGLTSMMSIGAILNSEIISATFSFFFWPLLPSMMIDCRYFIERS